MRPEVSKAPLDINKIKLPFDLLVIVPFPESRRAPHVVFPEYPHVPGFSQPAQVKPALQTI